MFRLSALLIIAASVVLPAAADEPAADQVRQTVANSLPYIQREGVNWIEKRQCVSCHQVPFMVWSLNAAARHGFAVDGEKLAEWNHWAADWRNFSAPKNRADQEEQKTAVANIDTIYQLQLATRSYQTDKQLQSNLQPPILHVVAAQDDAGFWKPCGQLPLQRRPARETEEVSTMWALLALAETETETHSWSERRARAGKWLSAAKEGQSTEWWAVKLLLETQEGRTDDDEQTRSKLIAARHNDGGWGWLTAGDSDAFGTGLALYALSRSGVKADDPVVVRACGFLASSQQKDGSWKVNGTKQNAAERVTPTAAYWGTCWAVIGLLETLDEPADASRPTIDK